MPQKVCIGMLLTSTKSSPLTSARLYMFLTVLVCKNTRRSYSNLGMYIFRTRNIFSRTHTHIYNYINIVRIKI